MEVRGHVFPKFLNFTSVEARKSIYRINIRSLFTTKHSTLSFLFCFPSSPFDGDHFATSESKMKSTRRVKILEDVPQVSAWLEREREDVVAVTDGGGKGGRGIERGEEKRREEKRRERGRRAGECWRQLPRCCRINFGGPQTQTVSVDSIERFYLRLLSAGLSLRLAFVLVTGSFSRTNLCVSIGRKCFQSRLFSAVAVLLFFNEAKLR